VKKVCGVDHYGAPPMDGSKGSQGGGASNSVRGLGTSGAYSNACGGANGDGSIQGPGGARDEASGGACASCEEGRAD
jgi:hypothetical protein